MPLSSVTTAGLVLFVVISLTVISISSEAFAGNRFYPTPIPDDINFGSVQADNFFGGVYYGDGSNLTGVAGGAGLFDGNAASICDGNFVLTGDAACEPITGFHIQGAGTTPQVYPNVIPWADDNVSDNITVEWGGLINVPYIPLETDIDANARGVMLPDTTCDNNVTCTSWGDLRWLQQVYPHSVPWADANVADNITLTNITQITNRSYTNLSDLPYITSDADIDNNVLALMFPDTTLDTNTTAQAWFYTNVFADTTCDNNADCIEWFYTQDSNANTECDGNTALTGDGECIDISQFYVTGGAAITDTNFETTADFNTQYWSRFDYNAVSGIYIGITLASFVPSLEIIGLTGYSAANKLCDLNYSYSHLCTVDEIIHSVRLTKYVGWTGTAWIAAGNPGYVSNSNDCGGFVQSSTSYLGAFWNFDANRSNLTACNGTKPLACCR